MKMCVHIKLSVSVIHSLTLFLPSVNKLDTSAMAKWMGIFCCHDDRSNQAPCVERGDSVNDSPQEGQNSILICPVLS